MHLLNVVNNVPMPKKYCKCVQNNSILIKLTTKYNMVRHDDNQDSIQKIKTYFYNCYLYKNVLP